MNSEKRSIRRVANRSHTNSESKISLYGQAQTLSRDMSKLVNRKLFSDVHFFVGPDREKVYGHRCILSARNETFRQLFLAEPVKASFEMSSVRPVTFLLLVYFLYTNSISFDRLDIYEVFDLMKTAEQYKCPELEKLAEFEITLLLDPKTVFEFLSVAFQPNREKLKSAALEYIEDYSSSILIPTNKDILSLTPAAMQAILESSLLEIDEIQAIELACFWAEHHLARARERCADMERGQRRTSIIHIKPVPGDSPQDSSLDSSPLVASRDRELSFPGSGLMQQAFDDVAKVMMCLRLVLLQPNELAKLEESQLTKRLIPEECFVNAWRQQALRAAQLSLPDDYSMTADVKKPRRGTVMRAHRSKSVADPARRAKSVIGRPSEWINQ